MNFVPSFDFSVNSVLFYCLCAFGFIQLLYVIFIFARLAFYKRKPLPEFKEAVSVIIAARNESENLYNFLPKILDQDYPNFEVVVVNHQSIDDSSYVLNAFKQSYGEKLRIIEVERSKHLGTGKKFPLSLGIKAAKYEHLVFTDADCEPTSNQWLKLMSAHFSKNEIVLGYAPYLKRKSFLNFLIRFDTLMIAVNYLSFALAKIPFMGVGRNLAYKKSTYEKVNGFKSHYSVISGDDDLFIQEAAKNKNYTIEIDEKTFCYSKAKKNYKNWSIQKARHYTTAPHYQVIKKLLLGIYPLSLLMMLLCFILLFKSMEYHLISASVFLFVILIKWWIQGMCFAKLKGRGFIALFPLLDYFYAILIPWMYYTSDSSTHKWK